MKDIYINNIDSEKAVNNFTKKVTGFLHISCKEHYSKINTLGNIELVELDAYLRYSFISDLGELKIVNGNLNLRDTLINDLGKLEIVNGKLDLPKRLENKLDLKNLQVKGSIKYWNDDKKWKRPNFEDYKELENIKSDFYNNFQLYHKNNQFEKAWNILRIYNFRVLNTGVNISEIYKFEKLLNRKLLEPIDIITSTGSSILNRHTSNNLTSFYNHLNQRIEILYSENKSFFISFFGDIKLDFKKLNSSFIIKKNDKTSKEKYVFNEQTFLSYRNHFCTENEYSFRKNQLKTHFKINYVSNDNFNCFIETALIERLKKIVREEEDEFRVSLGLPKIGEGWISETELFQKLKQHFSNYTVIHHGKPKWLGRQHFDIWFPELNIAIEYQGLQHDIAVEYFGGEISFEANQKRDELKKQKCKDNKCHLIEVRPDYVFEKLINDISLKIKKYDPNIFLKTSLNPI